MGNVYITTGITGFLGHTIAEKLVSRGESVIGLKLPQDGSALLPEVTYVDGDVTRPETLEPLFTFAAGRDVLFIHCTAMIAIESKNKGMRTVNVEGVRNILTLCEKYQVSRLIHVSSVHAIPGKPKGTVITETKDFSPEFVVGDYTKIKAEATALVLQAVSRGLNVSIVHPSGIIGPGDTSGGYLTETCHAFIKGKFPCTITGGYDLVDVRDVAEGILCCVEHGRASENYILSGRYITIRELFDILSEILGRKSPGITIPLGIVRLVAPLAEKIEKAVGAPLLLTPYSTYTLGSNGLFSHQKASEELGYSPRPVEDTLKDMVEWLNTIDASHNP